MNHAADTALEVDAALRRLADAAAQAEAATGDADAIAALQPLFEDAGWLHALATSPPRPAGASMPTHSASSA